MKDDLVEQCAAAVHFCRDDADAHEIAKAVLKIARPAILEEAAKVADSFIQVTKHGPTPPTIDEVTGDIISLGNVKAYESRRIVNPAHIASAIRALAYTTGQEGGR